MNKRVKQILSLCDKTGSVIVSYGLAPNPFGFCFEAGEDMTDAQMEVLSDLLESLTDKETKALKALVFGSGK